LRKPRNMAKKLSKNDIEKAKGYAKILYIKDKLMQKEIAEKTGISEKTICKWVADGHWEKERKNFLLTRQEQMVNLLDELTEINAFIKRLPAGLRFADSKMGDVRRKLIKDIKELETSSSKPEAISACIALLEFIRKVDFEKAKELSRYIDGFIKSIL
jgi:DNA-binding XRE family transcriptional regulator